MNICKHNGHEDITFTGNICPLCDRMKTITTLLDQRTKLQEENKNLKEMLEEQGLFYKERLLSALKL